MNSRSITVGTVIALLAVNLPSVACAQERGASPPQADLPGLVKGITNLEQQLSAALVEIQNSIQMARAEPEYHVLYPKHLDAAKFAEKLPCLLPEDCVVKIVAVDEKTKSILIHATPRAYQKARESLERLDVRKQVYTKTFFLQHITGTGAEKALQNAFRDEPNCAVSAAGKSKILVWATMEIFQQAEEILKEIDVKDK